MHSPPGYDSGLTRIGLQADAARKRRGYVAEMQVFRLIARRAGDAFVVAIAISSELEVWRSHVAGARLGLSVVVLVASLPLLLRDRFPLAAPLTVMGTLAAASFPYGTRLRDLTVPIAMVIMSGWVLGRRNERPRAVLGIAAALACIQIINANFSDRVVSDIVFVSLLVSVPWGAGYVLRRREAQVEELHGLAARLEREREQRARGAVADERLRIARELHDVVAHSISVMTIQAGAARLLLDDEPDRAEEPLLRVEETGRQTLAEMRRLLGVLQTEPGNGDLEPRPSFAHLDSLLRRFRAAGLPIELDVEGAPRALPAGIDLAAFRIVQEALTNTLKHAGPATARVALRYAPETIDLEIADDGRGPGAAPGSGHGLVGMRERVAIYGGTLDAGQAPEGGFVVRARLPLPKGRG
jgi:signal transduction histidine kinase